ncbi:MAG: D-alanyl-D-alanine carboxypeptidase [Clostridia bacterium]|nr:D-alanyl-D-alanine carboxypeptidase [Clostridia bacterium]
MKKLFYIILCFVLAACAVIPAFAEPSRSDLDAITTPYMCLYEADTGTVVYQRNAEAKAYPASTTKIMTAIVALEHCSDINALYTCGWEAQNGFGSKSSLLGLKYGYVVSIKDMLYGLMLCSGNDCGACLAVATAGSIDNFIALMNEKAAEIGMTGTHYTNPHGLHDDNHYTTAYDMALLMQHALKNDVFREIIKTIEYTVTEVNGKFTKTIQTSNKFLFTKEGVDWDKNEYEYAIGGKTGETNVAGYCLVEAAQKDGVTLIAVLMGDPNYDTSKFYYRFHSARTLFEYGFARYASYDLAHYGVTSDFNINTTGYAANDPNSGVVTAYVDTSSVRVSGLKEDIDAYSASSFTWLEPELDPAAVAAPVNIGDKLGTATLTLNGKELFTGDLIAASSVQADASVSDTDVPSGIIDEDHTGRRDVNNLTVSKNGGNADYTVWVYYNDTLFTMQDGKEWYYLFCDGDVFRSARVPAAEHEIRLYAQSPESGAWEPTSSIEPGGRYAVVSGGKALQAVRKGRSLAALPVTVGDDGSITDALPESAVWTFTPNGAGFQLTSGGLYLHRSGGDGLLFWILIAVLVIAVIVVIRLIATNRRRRRNPKRRGRYKIYRM